MNMEAVIPRIVATMTTREREGKEYGVIVIAEGLAEFLPSKYLAGVGRDEHGHINISAINLHDVFAELDCQGIQAPDRQETQSQRPSNWATKPAVPSRTPST